MYKEDKWTSVPKGFNWPLYAVWWYLVSDIILDNKLIMFQPLNLEFENWSLKTDCWSENASKCCCVTQTQYGRKIYENQSLDNK
jgi:hypothetical protein